MLDNPKYKTISLSRIFHSFLIGIYFLNTYPQNNQTTKYSQPQHNLPLQVCLEISAKYLYRVAQIYKFTMKIKTLVV